MMYPAGISGGSRGAMINDITAAPPREMATTTRGPILSATMPPIGRAITAAMAKPAVRVPVLVIEAVDILQPLLRFAIHLQQDPTRVRIPDACRGVRCTRKKLRRGGSHVVRTQVDPDQPTDSRFAGPPR